MITLLSFNILSIRINRSWDFCILFDLTSPIQKSQAYKAHLIYNIIVSETKVSNNRFVFIQNSFNSNKQQQVSSYVRFDLALPNQQSQAFKAIILNWSSILSFLNQKSLTIALFSFKIHSIQINREWVCVFFLTLLYQISRARHKSHTSQLIFNLIVFESKVTNNRLFSFKNYSIR